MPVMSNPSPSRDVIPSIKCEFCTYRTVSLSHMLEHQLAHRRETADTTEQAAPRPRPPCNGRVSPTNTEDEWDVRDASNSSLDRSLSGSNLEKTIFSHSHSENILNSNHEKPFGMTDCHGRTDKIRSASYSNSISEDRLNSSVNDDLYIVEHLRQEDNSNSENANIDTNSSSGRLPEYDLPGSNDSLCSDDLDNDSDFAIYISEHFVEVDIKTEDINSIENQNDTLVPAKDDNFHMKNNISPSAIGNKGSENSETFLPQKKSVKYSKSPRVLSRKKDIKKTEGLYKCEYCKFTSAYFESYKRHHVKHTGIGMYSCHFCPYESNNSFNFKLHLNKHTGDNTFSCKKCKFQTIYKQVFNRHVKNHEKEIDKSLSSTAVATDSPNTLPQRHLGPKKISYINRKTIADSAAKEQNGAVSPKSECNVTYSPDNNEINASLDTPINNECIQKNGNLLNIKSEEIINGRGELLGHRCVTVTTNNTATPVAPALKLSDVPVTDDAPVNQHLLSAPTRHPKRRGRPPGSKNKNKCKKLKIEFVDMSKINDQLTKINESPLKSNFSLKPSPPEMHYSGDQNESKPVDTLYNNNGINDTHDIIEREDDSIATSSNNFDGKYYCTFCNFVSKWYISYKRHMIIHTGDGMLSCPHCQYKTNNSGNLKLHINKHTGESTLQCPDCQYSTVYKQLYKAHVARHTGEGLLCCTYCTYTTGNIGNYKQHLETHQRNELRRSRIKSLMLQQGETLQCKVENIQEVKG